MALLWLKSRGLVRRLVQTGVLHNYGAGGRTHNWARCRPGYELVAKARMSHSPAHQ